MTKLVCLRYSLDPLNTPKGGVISISRNGDLINQVFLEVELPSLQTDYLDDPTGGTGDYDLISYTNSIGNALILTVQVEIGGQPIDRQYGTWLEIKKPMSQKVAC
jgi:hypothetical protein